MSNNLKPMKRGDGRTITVEAFYPEGHALAGQNYPLTGATIWFTAKRSPEDSDANAIISKKTGGNGITILSAPDTNKCVIDISSEDTIGLTESERLVCDVQVKQGANDPFTLWDGVLPVELDVTQAIV